MRGRHTGWGKGLRHLATGWPFQSALHKQSRFARCSATACCRDERQRHSTSWSRRGPTWPIRRSCGAVWKVDSAITVGYEPDSGFELKRQRRELLRSRPRITVSHRRRIPAEMAGKILKYGRPSAQRYQCSPMCWDSRGSMATTLCYAKARFLANSIFRAGDAWYPFASQHYYISI